MNFLSYYIVARYFLCSLKFTIYYKKLWYNNDTTGGMNLHNNPVAIRNYLKVCSKIMLGKPPKEGKYIPGETPKRVCIFIYIQVHLFGRYLEWVSQKCPGFMVFLKFVKK